MRGRLGHASQRRGHLRGLVAVAALSLPWVLACGGGASVDPVAHLEPLCALPMVPGVTELATVSGVATTPLEGTLVVVSKDGYRVDWHEQGDASVLQTELMHAYEMQKELSRYSGKPVGPPNIAAEPGVSARDVGVALKLAHQSGYTEARLLFTTGEDLGLPEPLDPAFADELRTELDALDPAERQMRLAEIVEGEIALCPPAQETFAAVAAAPADMKCLLIARGMAEALPSCPLTDGDRVLTLMNVVSRPSYDKPIVSVTVTLDETADGLPEGSWQEVAEQAALHDGKAIGWE